MHPKFYFCPLCGDVIILSRSGFQLVSDHPSATAPQQSSRRSSQPEVTPVCCSHPMQLLEPRMVEPKLGEKHLPFLSCTCDNLLHVQIGASPHPMTPDHFIRLIYLETDRGAQLRYLHPGDHPTATFCLVGELPRAVYALCSTHSLWQTLVSSV